MFHKGKAKVVKTNEKRKKPYYEASFSPNMNLEIK